MDEILKDDDSPQPSLDEEEDVLSLYNTEHPYSNLLCTCVNLYTFKYDKCLTEFLKNNFIVNQYTRESFCEAITTDITNITKYSEDSDHYENRLNGIKELDHDLRSFDHYQLIKPTDLIITDNIKIMYEITCNHDQSELNIPVIMTNNIFKLDGNVVRINSQDAQAIAIGYNYLSAKYNLQGYDIMWDNSPNSIELTIDIIIGRVLYNMYAILSHGFISFDEPLHLFAGMSSSGLETGFGQSHLSTNPNIITYTTKRILSTSLDENTAIKFITCLSDDDLPVLVMLNIPQYYPILPVRVQCTSHDIVPEKEIMIRYADSFITQNKVDGYVLKSHGGRCSGFTNKDVHDFIQHYLNDTDMDDMFDVNRYFRQLYRNVDPDDEFHESGGHWIVITLRDLIFSHFNFRQILDRHVIYTIVNISILDIRPALPEEIMVIE